jgi:hypothetical protein
MKSWRPRIGQLLAVLVALCAVALIGCRKDRPTSSAPAAGAESRPASGDPLAGGPYPTLLLSKAQFGTRVNEAGQQVPAPMPAKLVLMRKTESGWASSTLEDPDSNVLHKALIIEGDGLGPGILTIGGTKAALKVWQRHGGAWTQRTLWQPDFGGKWSRLRDVEMGDVTGDGVAEIVVATHDQGVIGVLRQEAGSWQVTELDREPRTFVHEIEIGDVDGDGQNEFFATRSEPNQATLVSQPGQVVMYRWNGTTFPRTVIDAPEGTHAKEILAADPDRTGHATLFAAIEARTELRGGTPVVLDPVRIKVYDFSPGGVTSRVVATLNDRQCRCLSPGDVDGDGRTDIVATGMDSGVWLLRRQADGTWQPSLIDADSSGYEHAALVANLEEAGRYDVYVASDRQRELRRYRWETDHFTKQVLATLPEREITFSVTAGRF